MLDQIIFQMNQTPAFRGILNFLSNFYPVKIEMYGKEYPSVENAFQAAKCINPLDRIPFTTCSAKEAKFLGRKVKTREDWNSFRLTAMQILLERKFKYKDLREKLLQTEDIEIIEKNNWNDKFWGQCKGEGKNHLGIILMNIRTSFQNK